MTNEFRASEGRDVRPRPKSVAQTHRITSLIEWRAAARDAKVRLCVQLRAEAAVAQAERAAVRTAVDIAGSVVLVAPR